MRCCVVVFVLFCTFSSIWTPVHSTWIEDGICISEDGTRRYGSRMVLSDNNAVIIVWWNEEYHVLAQKIDLEGNPLWGPDGIDIGFSMRQVPDGPPLQPPQAVSDGAGGVIVTWDNIDWYLMGPYIIAKRVHSSGILMWENGEYSDNRGIIISPQPYNHHSHRVAVMQNYAYDGAVVTWVDRNDWYDTNIYAQAIDIMGSLKWPSGGYAICDTSGVQENCEICALTYGGVFIVWQDERNGDPDIYIQRVWASPVFQHQGLPLCTAQGSQINPTIASYDEFAVVAWRDSRPGAEGIYAQKIDWEGNIQWASDGIRICSNTDNQINPCITPDNLGGYVITWLSREDLYAQRIDSNGNSLWGSNGIHLSAQGTAPPVITADSNGNTYICWSDSRMESLHEYPAEDEDNIYIQKLDPAGTKQWSEGGLPLSTAAGKQFDPQILSVGEESVICSWTDWRDNSWYESDIYCQYVDCPAPDKPAGLRGRPLFNDEELLGLLISWDEHADDDELSYVLHKGFDRDFIPSADNLVCVTSNTMHFDNSWNYMPHAYYKLGIGTLDECHSWYTVLEYEDIYTDADISNTPPARIGLNNYPNPFNPSTTIAFDIPATSHVRIEIFDTAGRRVRILADAPYDAGRYSMEWNGRSDSSMPVSSGIYFCRLNTGTETMTIKMILLK